MKSVSFCLGAWSAWTLGDKAENTGIAPALLRRRVTPIGQKALNAAWHLPETANARLVLSSRHGEFGRTSSLLEAAAKRDSLSPADFTLSVHHALIGLLSIACINHRGHVAVSSGEESFCFGLLEAIACLMENPTEAVVLIHYEEPLPAPFSTFSESSEQPIVLALALKASGEGESFLLGIESSSGQARQSTSHALNFLYFLKGNAKEALSIGESMQWRWTKHAVV